MDGVLDYARPPRLEFAPVDLVDLARGALQAALADAPTVRGELRTHGAPSQIVTDGERLRGVLVNVLLNARDAVLARNAPAEGPDAGPEVSMDISPERDGRVTIAVCDRGIGLNPEQKARVFDPYFTTKRTGTGLGLAIARNLVDALGGSITVESEEGRGTTMRLEVPTRPVEAA